MFITTKNQSDSPAGMAMLTTSSSTPTLFCNSLRRRPSYASAVPSLLQQSRFVVREQLLNTHDIAVPMHVVEGDRRHLRFLLLSPSGLTNAKLATTIERIRHFSFLSTDPSAIIFLLNPPRATSVLSGSCGGADGVIAYTKLQAEMSNHADLPHIPVLPLNKLDGLEALLCKHAALHVNHQPDPEQRGAATSRQLMQHCTLQQPMHELTANVVSDFFDNLPDLATTAFAAPNAPTSNSPTAIAAFALSVLSQEWDEHGVPRMSSDDATPQGRLRALKSMIEDVEVAGLVDFWREEYQID